MVKQQNWDLEWFEKCVGKASGWADTALDAHERKHYDWCRETLSNATWWIRRAVAGRYVRVSYLARSAD